MKSDLDKQVREKFVSRGAGALSDAELLSILLGEEPGAAYSSSLEMAETLLDSLPSPGGLAALAAMDAAALRRRAGLGMRRAAVIAAALETGRRLGVLSSDNQETILTDGDAERIFRPLVAHLPHEEFWVAYLSAGNRVVEKVRVSQGGVQGTVVDHKLIVKRAVERLCCSIVVVHNHPSGVARPSDEDVAVTGKLVRAASLFDIAVLDHLIVTRGECFSFRREGLL